MYVCLSFVSSDLFSEAVCLLQGGYIVYLFTFIQKVSLEVQSKKTLNKKNRLPPKTIILIIFFESSEIGCHVLILVDLQYVCHANLLLMTPCVSADDARFTIAIEIPGFSKARSNWKTSRCAKKTGNGRNGYIQNPRFFRRFWGSKGGIYIKYSLITYNHLTTLIYSSWCFQIFFNVHPLYPEMIQFD